VKLVLVRAGPPEFQGRLAGALELPLSAEGRDRARAAAALIHAVGDTAAVHGPPAGHAEEAAAILATALGAKVRAAPDLAEVDMGLWQGLDPIELAERHGGAFASFQKDARAVVPPEAEEVDEARERLGKALTRLRRAHRREARLVVVVASELAFALLVSAAEGKEAPAQLWRLRQEGPDVRRFEL
jgi:broad specificity phosphatase PhoE